MLIELQAELDDVIQPLGHHAVEFFLAASLYHARKVSFASAAHIAGLSFEGFRYRLEEHFDKAFIVADESVLEDVETIDNLAS